MMQGLTRTACVKKDIHTAARQQTPKMPDADKPGVVCSSAKGSGGWTGPPDTRIMMPANVIRNQQSPQGVTESPQGVLPACIPFSAENDPGLGRLARPAGTPESGNSRAGGYGGSLTLISLREPVHTHSHFENAEQFVTGWSHGEIVCTAAHLLFLKAPVDHLEAICRCLCTAYRENSTMVVFTHSPR